MNKTTILWGWEFQKAEKEGRNCTSWHIYFCQVREHGWRPEDDNIHQLCQQTEIEQNTTGKKKKKPKQNEIKPQNLNKSKTNKKTPPNPQKWQF